MAQMVSANHTAVISPEYCDPHSVQISIKKKTKFFATGHEYEVKDASNGKIMFIVKYIPSFFSRTKVVIFDLTGKVIVTLREKTFSWRSRWEAYRGESKDKRDIIFSARLSSAFQFTTKLDVFLANNTLEKVCDYKMKTNWMESSCDIFVGPSTSTLIAQMHKKQGAWGTFLGRDNFMVSLQPNVDQAFIVALIVILEEIVTAIRRRSSSSGSASASA